MKSSDLSSQQFDIMDEILSASSDYIYLFDRDARLVYANEAGVRALRPSQSQVIGKTWRELGLPKEMVKPFVAGIKEVFKTGESLTAQASYPTSYGAREFAYMLKPVKDGDGRISFVVCSMQDITEQKRAEKALQESAQYYQAIFDKSSIGMALVSLKEPSAILDINPTLHKMLGYDRNELLGRSFMVITHPEDIEPNWKLFDELQKGKRDHYQMEKRYITKSGQVVWGHLTVSLVQGDGSDEVYCIAMVADITERKRAEEEREKVLCELNSLLELTDVKMSALGLDEMLDSLLGRLVTALAADTAAILLKRGELLTARASVGLPREVRKSYSVDVGQRFEGAVAHLAIPLYVEDAQVDPLAPSPHIVGQGIRSMLGVPLMLGTRVIGVLHVGWLRPHPRSDSETRLLNVVADRFAMAITNAHLYERTKVSEQLCSALNDINTALTSAQDFEEMVQRVVKDSSLAIGSEAASVFIRQGDDWELRYAYGFSEELIGLRFASDEAKGVALASKTRELIVVNDAYGDERVNRDVMKTFGIRSLLVVPLVARDEIIGIVSFMHRSAPVEFSDMQVDFAKKLGAYVSLALDNARLYQAL